MDENSDIKQDPKLKLFIRLPRDKFSQGQEDQVKQQLFDLLGDTPVKSFEPRISSGYCFLHFETRLLAAQGHDKIFNQLVNGHSLRPCFGFTPAENQAVRAGIKDEEIERNHRTLFVKNLPAGVGQEDVTTKFQEWGEIAKVSVVKTRTGLAAFVLFKRFTPAIQCVEDLKNGFEMQGPQGSSQVSVELSKNKNLSRRVEKFTGGGPMGPFAFAGARGGIAGPGGRGFMPPGGRGWGAPGGHSSQGPWAQYWSTGGGGWGNEGRGRGGSPPTWAPWMRGGAGGMNSGGRGGSGGGQRGGRFTRQHRPY